MSNYNKKTVFIGIDVHKKTYSVSCVSNNEILKQSSMPACPEKLIKYFKGFAKIINNFCISAVFMNF